MQTATRALIWRQWRMTRTPGLLTILLAVSMMVMDVLVYEEELVLSAFACVFGSIMFALFSLVLDSDFSNISVGFPRSLFGLPLRSSKLAVFELAGRTVAVVVVSVTLCVALLAANWIVGLTHEWGLNVSGDFYRDVPQLLLVLLFPVAIYTFVQVVYWYPGGVQALIGIVLVTALVPPIRNAFVATVQAIGEIGLTARILLTLLVIGLCYMAACGAVHVSRKGVGAASLTDLPFPIPSFRVALRSPLLAQCWYEWRSFGRTLPGVTLAILSLLIVCLYQVFSSIRPTNVQPDVVNSVNLGTTIALLSSIYAPGCVAIAAFVIGVLLMARDFQERNKLGTFVYVRPLQTRTLAMARLRTGLAGLGSAALLCLIIVAGLHLTSMSPGSRTIIDQLLQLTGTDSAVALAVSYLVVVLITAWVLLWLGVPIVLTVIAAVYPLAFCAGLVAHPRVAGYVVVETLLAIGLVVACISAGARAVKNRTLYRQDLLKGLVTWILVGIFFRYHAEINRMRPASGDPTGEWAPWLFEEIIIWGLAFLPVLPIISVPLTLKWLRHR